MKLGVMAVLFGDKDLKWVCDFLVSKGVQTIEIGCGGFPGKAICDPERCKCNAAVQGYAGCFRSGDQRPVLPWQLYPSEQGNCC